MEQYAHQIAAFVSGIAVDVLSTLVFHYTAKNKAFAAASVNTLVYAGILFVFVDVGRDNTLAIPYLTGIFVGGILGIWIKKRLEASDRQK